jgi:hypothetical protein
MRASEFSGGGKTLGSPANPIDTTADIFTPCDRAVGMCFALVVTGYTAQGMT